MLEHFSRPSPARRLIAGGTALLMLAGPVWAELPAGGSITAGSGSIAGHGNTLTITQQSDRLAADWQSFSIGRENTVTFVQPSASAVALNRVLGSEVSTIQGALNANGRVYLLNPNGVLFTPTAQVNVGGLVASTLQMSDEDFLAGRDLFAGDSTASVVNQGTLTAADGGRIALIAARIVNEGMIEAKGGEVLLGAGRKVTLDLGGPVPIRVEEGALAALIEQGGAIRADDGTIYLTAKAADSLAGSVINHTGLSQARSLGTGKEGEIVLLADMEGGTVNNIGTLMAGGGQQGDGTIRLQAGNLLQQGTVEATGGKIEIQAKSAYFGDGRTSVENAAGQGGSIAIDTTAALDAVAGHKIDASGAEGGSIRIDGGEFGRLMLSSSLLALGSAGKGGQIKATAWNASLLGATVQADGLTEGGTIHWGGGWQGGGSLRQADYALIGPGSLLSAKGGQAGGEVAVWSKEATKFFGKADATGGGRIEISSKNLLEYKGEVNAGAGGTVLFDPKNLTLVESIPDSLSLVKLAHGSSQAIGGQPTTLSLAAKDDFGLSVALDGDRLAVGARYDDTGGGTVFRGEFADNTPNRGAVYLFSGAGTDFSGLYLRTKLAHGSNVGGGQTLNLPIGTEFGTSLALDGDRLAAGAAHDGNGAVYLFNGVGTDYTGINLKTKLTNGSSVGGGQTLNLTLGDTFGWSVALDGDRLAVGAGRDDTGGDRRGAVYLFNGVGTDYSGLYLNRKLAHGSAVGGGQTLSLADFDYFGNSLSLDGDRLAVGAMGDNAGSSRGSVYLFNGVGTDYSGLYLNRKLGHGSQVGGGQSLDFTGADFFHYFGHSVSLDGDRLAVGATGDETGYAGYSNGAVYLFNGVGTDYSGLHLRTKLTLGSNVGGETLSFVPHSLFGCSVALDGDRLVSGAYWDDTGGPNTDRGAVFLFNGVGTDFSGLHLKSKIAHGSIFGGGQVLSLDDFDHFGYSVALDGDKLAVAAPHDDTGDVDTGAVYLFGGVGTDFSGLYLNRKLAHGSSVGGGQTLNFSPGDYFGSSVALDGDRLAVGAYWDDTGGNGRGAAYLFSGVGTDFSGLYLRNKLAHGSSVGGGQTLSLGNDYNFGQSVALDGDRLAVGAWGDANGATGAGIVYLFNGIGTDYSGLYLRKQLSHGSAVGGGPVQLGDYDNFGGSVALDGDRLVVGSPYHDAGGGGRGAVYLFNGVGSDFSGLYLRGKMAHNSYGLTLADNDNFGASVSLNGDMLVIGAPKDASGYAAGTDRGSVYVYSGAASANYGGMWQRKEIESATLVGDVYPYRFVTLDLAAYGRFGTSVSLDGDRLAVGAPNFGEGSVYLLTGVGSDHNDEALQVRTKLAHGTSVERFQLGDYGNFGRSVSLDGDMLAVGADNDGGKGAVYLFSGAGTDYSGLNLRTKLANGSSIGGGQILSLADGDYFGSSVALDGDRLAVGAHRDDTGNTDPGAVYLFSGVGADFSGLHLRTKLAHGSPVGGGQTLNLAYSDYFGFSVALDGDSLAVGAYGDNAGSGFQLDKGAVYLFNGVGTDFSGLYLRSKLAHGSGVGGGQTLSLANSDHFGWSVSLDGDRVAVGARGDDTGGNGRGAVYLFNGAGTDYSGLNLRTKLAHGSGVGGGQPLSLANSDTFGASVSLDGDRLAVGAAFDDTGGADRGAVYLFQGVGTDFTGLNLRAKLAHGSSVGQGGPLSLADVNIFGTSISLDGDRLAVGTPNDDTGGGDRGAVYLLKGIDSGIFAGVLPPEATFAANPSAMSYMRIGELTNILNTGTNVTLQANNDLNVNGAIAVNNGAGNGGNLTLQAGRSVNINHSIATDNGSLTIVANETPASGLVYSLIDGNGLTQLMREMGNATIAQAAGTTIDAGSGAISLTMAGGANWDTTSGDIVLANLSAGRILVDYQGPTPGAIVLQNGATLTATEAGDSLILNAGANGRFRNEAGASALAAANGRWLVYSANPASDTRGGLAYAFKQYDAVYGDTVLGTGNGVLYSVAPVITPTPTFEVVKIYDGTTQASTLAESHTFSGVIDGDTVTWNNPIGTYDTKDVGESKTVTWDGFAITDPPHNGGAPVYGYAVSSTNPSAASGAIVRAPLTVTTDAVSKTYDGTTSAPGAAAVLSSGTLYGSDSLAGGTFAFADKHAGTGKTVTVSGVTVNDGNGGGNYTVSYASNTASSIDKADLTVTTSDVLKTYDGTTDAAGSAVVTVGTLYGSDSLAGGSFAFADPNAGSGKTVTVSGVTVSDGNGGGNYNLVLVDNTTSTIDPAPLTVTADDAVKTYGQTVAFNGTEFVSSGLQNGETIGSVTLASAGAAATAGVGGGPYAITAANATGGTFDADNYAITYADGSLTVNPALLTVTANDAGKTYGQTATFNGTEFTSSALQNGETIGSVTLTSAGAAATAGVSGSPYAITPSNAAGGTFDAGNYLITYEDGSLTIAPAPLTITANDASKTYGQTVVFTGNEFTGSGLQNGETIGSVTLASAGAAATANVGGSPYVIAAGNASGGTFAAGNYVIIYEDGTLTVNPAPLTVTANDAGKTYDGQPYAGGNGASYSGFVNGENPAVLAGTLSYGGSSQGAQNAGAYVIRPGGLTSGNYAISFIDGTLTISPASLLLVAADNQGKTYGSADPALTWSLTSGTLAAGDAFSGSLVRDPGENVGNYAIRQGSLTAGPNYTLTFADGVLTIAPAPLTVTARDAVKAYDGTPWSGGNGVVYRGFVAGEDAGALGGTLTWGGSSQGAKDAGSYTLTPSGLTSNNYTITFVDGTLTISPMPLVLVAADDKSKVYGDADPALTWTLTAGTLAARDSLSGALVRDPGENAGTYAIRQGTLNAGANYTLSFTDGVLTITPAPLTVAAADQSRIYGEGNPAFTYSASGFRFDDGPSLLRGELASDADAASDAGSYAIGRGTLDADSNYTLNFTDGVLTVTPRPLVVAADDRQRRGGEANPPLTYSVGGMGLVNGDSAGSVFAGELATEATAASAPGAYAIEQGTLTASDGNYQLAGFVPGTLTVGSSPVALQTALHHAQQLPQELHQPQQAPEIFLNSEDEKPAFVGGGGNLVVVDGGIRMP